MKIEVEMTRKQRTKNKMADSDCGLRHHYLLNLPIAKCLYTRYPIVARRAWPLGRVRRASKGILHTSKMYIVFVCMRYVKKFGCHYNH